MVAFNEIQAQLMGISKRSRTLNIQEVKLLASLLGEHEQIMACLKGWYKGSVSVLCATDQRIIILDRGNMQKPYLIIDYTDILRLQQSTTVWVCMFAMVLKDQKHEFKMWGAKKSHDIHTFMQRHMVYLKKIAEQGSLLTSAAEPAKHTSLRVRSWRSFVRRVGNAAI